MQTFLPFSDYEKTAAVLDDKRLWKQIIESRQICKSIAGLYPTNAWRNHPATKMWVGHELELIWYTLKCCDEFDSRKIITKAGKIRHAHGERQKLIDLIPLFHSTSRSKPFWMGDERVHISHQSNLVRKMPEWYRAFFPDIPNDIPYYWPV